MKITRAILAALLVLAVVGQSTGHSHTLATPATTSTRRVIGSTRRPVQARRAITRRSVGMEERAIQNTGAARVRITAASPIGNRRPADPDDAIVRVSWRKWRHGAIAEPVRMAPPAAPEPGARQARRAAARRRSDRRADPARRRRRSRARSENVAIGATPTAPEVSRLSSAPPSADRGAMA